MVPPQIAANERAGLTCLFGNSERGEFGDKTNHRRLYKGGQLMYQQASLHN